MTHTHLRPQTIHGHLNGEDILHRGLHAHQDHLQGQQDQEHTQGHLHVLHIGKKTSDQESMRQNESSLAVLVLETTGPRTEFKNAIIKF